MLGAMISSLGAFLSALVFNITLDTPAAFALNVLVWGTAGIIVNLTRR